MNRLFTGLMICMGGIIVLLYWRVQKLNDTAHDYKLLYNQSKKEAKTWKDKSGKWRSRVETVDLSNRTLKDLVKNGDSHYSQLHKDFDGLKKSLKNLQAMTNLKSQSVTEFHTTLHDTTIIIYQTDTVAVAAKKFTWNDSLGYSTFTGVVTSNDVKGTFTTTDSLDLVTYWNRSWILGKKKYFTEIRSKNPNSKIVQNKSVVIRAKRRRLFGIL